MNRRQLRGCPLLKDCRRAFIIREYNKDAVCAGLHYDADSWILNTHDVTDECRKCGAWHMNWYEKYDSDKSASDAKGERHV